ncbi:uncharacterized protein LOC113353123 [Papaver somniferum]|uniref:uncharacterized protein LOC113353123 n=1 Tax=Papaver somniferum TaxID=3469 RepID=UPI000E703C47|nr:uncharacterized protein LOC113353123 [Papaver somniferum]
MDMKTDKISPRWNSIMLLYSMPAVQTQPVIPAAPIQAPNNNGLPDMCSILHCDASFDKDTNEAGSGLVLNDMTGTFKGCKLIKGVARTAEEAGCIAILEGIKWMEDKGISSFCIRSDAKNAIT